jgi:hypothetical protein
VFVLLGLMGTDLVQDENRFASKGAHLNLKRAEKARAAIAKLPGRRHTSDIFYIWTSIPCFNFGQKCSSTG